MVSSIGAAPYISRELRRSKRLLGNADRLNSGFEVQSDPGSGGGGGDGYLGRDWRFFAVVIWDNPEPIGFIGGWLPVLWFLHFLIPPGNSG